MEIYFSKKNKFSKENFEYGGQLSGIFIFSSAQQVEIKSANFTILSENPLSVNPQTIKDIEIKATIVEGKHYPID